MSKETSEFGKGLVYCLALWCCHFGNDKEQQLMKRSRAVRDNKFDTDNLVWWRDNIVPIYGSYEQTLSEDIKMWANGASDHFYDLEIPDGWKKKVVGKSLQLLTDKALEMGHGWTDDTYTMDDYNDLKTLTKKVCKLIDKELGIKAVEAQWGEL